MNISRLRIGLLVAMLVRGADAFAAPPSSAPPTALDDKTAQAREWVEVGAVEYSKQNWEAAREAFQKAWDLKQHYAIARNLADAEMRLGQYRKAAEHLRYHLANLPSEKEDRRAEAEQELAECRAHLSIVRISVNVPNATVRLDNAPVGASPIADELLLDPGKHVVAASEPGYATNSRTFDATAGESREISLVLEAQTPAAPPPSLDASPSVDLPHEGSGLSARTLVLITGSALTLAGVGLGVAYAIDSKNASNDAAPLRAQAEHDGALKGAPAGSECLPRYAVAACPALSDKNDQARTSSNIAIGSFIGAGVFGAATIVTYFVWPSRRAEDTRSPSVSLAPWNLDGARGLQVLGRF